MNSNVSGYSSVSMSASMPLAPPPCSWGATINLAGIGIGTQQANLEMLREFTQPKSTILVEQITRKLADLEKRIDILNDRLEAKDKAELVAKLEEIVKSLKK